MARVFLTLTGIVVMKWQDTREVCLQTTKYGLDMVGVQKKTRRPMVATSSSGDQRPKTKKTVAAVDYNQGKSGIDLSDQYTALATSLRKGIKWYRKLAFEILLGMALVNSYLVFRSMSPRKIGLLQFKEKLVEKMINLPKPEQHPRPVFFNRCAVAH